VALDYREPGPGFPGGRLTDCLDPRWPIGCDRIDNHSRADGTDDMNVLYVDGTVSSVTADSPEWKVALQYTQEP